MLKRTLLAALLVAPLLAHADPLADGISAYQRKDYAGARMLLEPLAKQGNAQAQLRLGLLHYYGHGVPENEQAAQEWIARAAAQGNADAQFQLANMYVYGAGARAVADADQRAAQLYFDAASQGHAEAQYSLGMLFLTGKGVEQNNEEAMKWIRRAADGGNSEAKAFVGSWK